MLEFALALALAQDPVKPPPPPPPPKKVQDPHHADIDARMADLKRKFDSTEDPAERQRLMDEMIRLKESMAHPGPRDISPEKFAKIEEDALAFLKETSPQMLAEAQRAKDGGRLDAYKGMIFEAYERSQHLKKLKEVDPASYELEVKLMKLEEKTQTLAREIRAAKDNDAKEDGKRELRKALAELFDARSDRQKRDIDMLLKEIEKLKERLNSRNANKEKIVDKRLSEMLGEADNLDW